LDQSLPGLRFDFYERVDLASNAATIRELTGMELYPEVNITTQDEQALLKGHLVLQGTYISNPALRTYEQLTHRIPLEITLPMNRIHNINDVHIEVDQLDVEMLSPTSLNVTGVLTIDGVLMENAYNASPVGEEEMVFSHRAEQQEPVLEIVEPLNIEPNIEPVVEQTMEEVIPEQPAVEMEETIDSQEIKIAFVSQPPDAVEPPQTEVQSAAPSVNDNPEALNGTMEWKKRLLEHTSNEPKFRKVKICIVQKDDTLETIALRYNANSRELISYNRLDVQTLLVGQTLFIP
jgi:stage VI sporulation protein D